MATDNKSLPYGDSSLYFIRESTRNHRILSDLNSETQETMSHLPFWSTNVKDIKLNGPRVSPIDSGVGDVECRALDAEGNLVLWDYSSSALRTQKLKYPVIG
jgi:hypothetical protein